MFWHIDADFVALAIIFIVFADIVINKAFSSPHWQDKIFAVVALSSFFLTLVDIISSAVMMMPNVNWWTYQLILTFYFITAPLSCIMWLIYTHSLAPSILWIKLEFSRRYKKEI